MSFQILDKLDTPVPINDLDKEAAQLWGKEVDNKHYAAPEGYLAANWFDAIGWAIHAPENYTTGWDNVKCTLWTIQARSLFSVVYDQKAFKDKMQEIKEYLRPYYKLIDYWESKGYIPVQIKD